MSLDLQQEELETLEAIFGDEFSRTDMSYKVQAAAHLYKRQIRVILSEDPEVYIVLLFEYPPDYPNVLPHYTLSAKWLTPAHNDFIQTKFQEIFEDQQGEPVIFQWTDYLRSSCLEDLGLEGKCYFLCT